MLKSLTKKHRETRIIFRDYASRESYKFDLSVLRPKFRSHFAQIGYPVDTYAWGTVDGIGDIKIRYPVSAAGDLDNMADDEFPEMFVLTR